MPLCLVLGAESRNQGEALKIALSRQQTRHAIALFGKASTGDDVRAD
jgi:hypothetical protein